MWQKKKKTSFDLRPLVWHIWYLATFFLLGRLPLVWNRAVAGMQAGVCFCAPLFMCIKETQECSSMQTRATAFMFISLSGEGECLSQEVWDVSLSQCLHVNVWARLKGTHNGGKVFFFSEKRCSMLSLTGRPAGGKWFIILPLPPHSSSSFSPDRVHLLLFFQPYRRSSRALLVRTHSQVKSVGSLGPGAYFCLCNNCFPGPLERRHVCPWTVWGGDVMKDAYEAFSKVVFCLGE